jgi:hypothetical protein
MLDPDYDAWKTRCNKQFGRDCIDYYLRLPRGDLYSGTQTRSDFASSYCSEQRRMGEVPCDVLCRDNSTTCLAQRRAYCSNVTLDDILSGTKTECACYLPQAEYKKHIEDIRKRLGDSVATELLRDVNNPYCFYAPCARSVPGLATRAGTCQSVAGCVQTVEIDTETQKHTVVTNVCNITTSTKGGTPGSPSQPEEPGSKPSSQTSFPWLWVIVGIAIVLVLIIVVVIISRRKESPGDAVLQSLLLRQALSRL